MDSFHMQTTCMWLDYTIYYDTVLLCIILEYRCAFYEIPISISCTWNKKETLFFSSSVYIKCIKIQSSYSLKKKDEIY